MPVDHALAARIRTAMADAPLLVERKMFGGIGWMIGGHMAVGAHSDGRMMVRCSREDTPDLASQPGAMSMMRGGKPMSGWILVDNTTVQDDQALALWIARGRAHASSMPPK